MRVEVTIKFSFKRVLIWWWKLSRRPEVEKISPRARRRVENEEGQVQRAILSPTEKIKWWCIMRLTGA